MLELTMDRVTKTYGSKIAVDKVSLHFTRGVYGLLGANGAGKTTLLRMLCHILYPESGEITCNGAEIGRMGREYRRLLGYLPQDFGYYPEFTAWKYMMYLASLKALPKAPARERAEEMLELVSLTADKDRKIKTFSGGMIRRLGIAQAMLNNPEILILDEPTAGLDPKERIRFRNIISSLSKDRIVILSTHIVSDVEYIADEILLMKAGQIIRQGTAEQIVKMAEGKVWECTVSPEQADPLSKRYAVSNLKNTENGVNLRIVSDEQPMTDKSRQYQKGPAQAISVQQAAPSLEDVYLYYFEEEGKKHEHI